MKLNIVEELKKLGVEIEPEKIEKLNHKINNLPFGDKEEAIKELGV